MQFEIKLCEITKVFNMFEEYSLDLHMLKT